MDNFEKVEKTARGLLVKYIEPRLMENENKMRQVLQNLQGKVVEAQRDVQNKIKVLSALNPEEVLERGYAILSGKITLGSVVKITTFKNTINAEIKEIKERK